MEELLGRGGGVKRVHDSYNDIISTKNLLVSWQEFLRGKRKRKDVAEFSLYLLDNMVELHADLKIKAYKHGAYQAFKINDPKPRDIHKASVRDRLVHHAICRILGPYFDRKFIFDSFSCRRYKGTHRAMNRFREYGRIVSRNHTRTAWALKCDVKKFFANIDHGILRNILARQIADQDTLWLLVQIINSFPKGLPLGNLTSQLLVNVYMNEFDHFVKRELKVGHYLRYADDFVVMSHDRTLLEEVLKKVSNFLREKLKLEIHPDKVFIKSLASGVDFLGWVHFPNCRVLRTSTKKRMINKIKFQKKGTKESYLGLLSHGNAYKLKRELKLLDS